MIFLADLTKLSTFDDGDGYLLSKQWDMPTATARGSGLRSLQVHQVS